MYEPLHLSGTDLLVADRINGLMTAASEVRGDRRSSWFRLSWPGRPQPINGHRPVTLGASGQRA